VNDRLSTLDALSRGFANVRGNPEIVAVSVIGSLAVLAVLLLSIWPWMSAVGIDPQWLLDAPELTDVSAWSEIAAVPSEILTRLGAFFLALTVGLTVSSIGYCWYFGGVLGVVVSGDAQAPVGGGREPDLFRTWVWRFFVLEANRLTWRVLAYLSIFLGLMTLVTLGFVALIVFASLLSAKSGAGAGLAVGCGGLLPLFFAFAAVFGAMSIGQADLPRPQGGAMEAARLGFQVLGRRMGAIAALFVLLITISMAIGLVLGGFEYWIGAALAGSPTAFGIAQVAIVVVQLSLGALVQLGFMASFVALARAERAFEVDSPA
jgi:hypothetical protein